MASKEVDYGKLVANLKEMINVLEYDSMRSSGKAKLNSSTLVSMYELVDRYEAAAVGKKATPTVEAEQAPVKKVGRPPKTAASN